MTGRRIALTAAALALGLCAVRPVHAAPTIGAIDVRTPPLFRGVPFDIAVTASDDVVQATATVDFRPGSPSLLRVPLAKQNGEWIGTATVPLGVNPRIGALATVKVLAFDAARARAESAIQVPISPLSAVYSPDTGDLDITCSSGNDTIFVSRDAAGQISVNGGAIPIARGPATVANTVEIDVYGQDGDDHLTIDRANGLLPPSQLYGGPGNDVLVGGGSADMLYGDDGDDVLDGGPGDEFSVGGPGDDTFLWHPGDGSDSIEGLDGNDTLQFMGSVSSEAIVLSEDGSRLRLTRDVANVLIDAAGIENVYVAPQGGADTLTVESIVDTEVVSVRFDLAAGVGSGVPDDQADQVIVRGTALADHALVTGTAAGPVVDGLGPQVSIVGADAAQDSLTVDAAAGNDVIDASALPAGLIQLTELGGPDADILFGSAGDDVLRGGTGDDFAVGGAGNDVFVWNPGDASDTLEGQAGNDTLVFNGSNANESIDVSANGARVRFLRDVAAISMDCNGVESFRFAALGGADRVTVNDLTGTNATSVTVDLSSPAGSGVGDGQADSVHVIGTNGDDVATLSGSAGSVSVFGLASTVSILASEPANDRLTVSVVGGDDVIDGSSLASSAIALTEEGGDGADVLIGGVGDDTLLGGAGDDVLFGGPGFDVLDGGTGDNILFQD